MFILFQLSKMDIIYLYTNLFKYLGLRSASLDHEDDKDCVDNPMNEEVLNDHMEQALTTKYSHVTYNKDEKRFIDNII